MSLLREDRSMDIFTSDGSGDYYEQQNRVMRVNATVKSILRGLADFTNQ